MQMEKVMAAVRRAHLEPLATASPDCALRRLAYNHPVLAVVDTDMSMPTRSAATVEDLLGHLYENCMGCLIVVHSGIADDIVQRKRLEAIHPFAKFVSKHDDPDALLDRVQRILGVRFGDLHVRHGLTIHEPSGEVFLHSVGVLLMLGAALGQEVVLKNAEAKAARRMGAWLERLGSPVRLIDLGHRHYSLQNHS